jgi:hypothetical protein
MHPSRIMVSTGTGWRYVTLALFRNGLWHEQCRSARESALHSKTAQRQGSGVAHGAVALLRQELRLSNTDQWGPSQLLQ